MKAPLLTIKEYFENGDKDTSHPMTMAEVKAWIKAHPKSEICIYDEDGEDITFWVLMQR